MARKNFHHPFDPYDIQQQFMEAVYQCIEDGQVGIFESPTGTGKSLSLLCGSLTWLREHKRKMFDESMRIDHNDDDEPEWFLEHARQARRKEALQLREDFERRLAQVRAAEDKLRQSGDSREPLNKRQKVKNDKADSNGDGELDDQYLLEEYDSDDGDETQTAGEYSNQTTKLLHKHGLLQLSASDDSPEQDVNEIKIFIGSRTHSQLSQLVGELRRVKLPPVVPPEDLDTHDNEVIEEVRQLSLGSRKNLCINPEVFKLKGQAAMNERCLELQQPKTSAKHKCPFIPKQDDKDPVIKFKDHALARIRDIEDLAIVGKKVGICPYYASRSAIGQAEVVTLPYPLLLQKSSREALGISLKGHVVVIDEAHNLQDAVESIYSCQISQHQLVSARESVITYLQKFRNRLKGANRAYVTQVVRVLDSLLHCIEHLQGNAGALQPDSLLAGKAVDQINLPKLIRYISESKLARKVEGYSAHLKTTIEAKHGQHNRDFEPETPTLTLVQNFLSSLVNPSVEGRFFWSKDNNAITLRYLLLDPSQHFREVVEEARAVILAGGTMSPMDDYARQLFPYLAAPQTLSCGHIVPKANLFVRAISADEHGPLTFNYKTRSDAALMDRLASLLLQALPTIKGGTVIFFTSYLYLDQVHTHWERDQVIKRLESTKAVFFDSKTKSADETLGAYAKAIASDPRGALLFSVLGGKLSEGINFSDDLGRCVIVVGLPYPNLQTPEWQAKLQYLETKAVQRGELKSKASREHVENVCMRAVNQAIGRVIRHRGDWAGILLLDARYAEKKIQAKLPGWIQGSLPTGEGISSGVQDVCSDLAAFFSTRASPQ